MQCTYIQLKFQRSPLHLSPMVHCNWIYLIIVLTTSASYLESHIDKLKHSTVYLKPAVYKYNVFSAMCMHLFSRITVGLITGTEEHHLFTMYSIQSLFPYFLYFRYIVRSLPWIKSACLFCHVHEFLFPTHSLMFSYFSRIRYNFRFVTMSIPITLFFIPAIKSRTMLFSLYVPMCSPFFLH